MSSFSEHFHYRVLGVLVDGVVPNALPQVLLNHLFWFNYSGSIARQAHAKLTRWHGTHPKRRCHGTNSSFCLVVTNFLRNISPWGGYAQSIPREQRMSSSTTKNNTFFAILRQELPAAEQPREGS